jgi:vacuolar protein sorting-associated protein 26
LSDCSLEKDLWVQIIQPKPEINNSLKMEVGIEDILHIEFEYQQAKYADPLYSISNTHNEY